MPAASLPHFAGVNTCLEVSPPYDTSDITALLGVRIVVEALGSLVAHGKLASHKAMIDKPVTY
jgi:agmatinase